MNVFVGENLGNNIFKLGIICLIGIAHLPEHLEYLEYRDSFEIKPMISPNIGRQAEKLLFSSATVPERAHPIIGNILHSIKLVASKALPLMPISGNVKFDDSWEEMHKKTMNMNSISMAYMDAETRVSGKDMGMMNQS
jgi:hypothetical protein